MRHPCELRNTSDGFGFEVLGLRVGCFAVAGFASEEARAVSKIAACQLRGGSNGTGQAPKAHMTFPG